MTSEKRILEMTDEEFDELEPGMPCDIAGDLEEEALYFNPYAKPDDPDVAEWCGGSHITHDGRVVQHCTPTEFYRLIGLPPKTVLW